MFPLLCELGKNGGPAEADAHHGVAMTPSAIAAGIVEAEVGMVDVQQGTDVRQQRRLRHDIVRHVPDIQPEVGRYMRAQGGVHWNAGAG